MIKRLFLAAAAAGLLAAAAPPPAVDETVRLAHPDLQWREMIPGVFFAPVYGDWEHDAHGKYVRIEPGTEVPLHTHTNSYRGVMISGRMTNIHPGDPRPVELAPGDYWHMPGGRPHSHACLSQEPCLFFTYGDSLWDVTPYDPA